MKSTPIARQKFISFLVLRQLAPRTIQSYTKWIVQLSRFHKRPPVDPGREIEPLLTGIKRPSRHTQPPGVFSPDEIQRLLTLGTHGDPLARAFLMTVYGCGLRLSEATHVRIEDIDSARLQLRVSNPKGRRQRMDQVRSPPDSGSALWSLSPDPLLL